MAVWFSFEETAVALQGTIDSFPLVDVLSLLESSRKTGRLELVGDRGRGALYVDGGLLVAAEVHGAPANGPTDAVWELLRFNDGSFEFASGANADEPRFSAEVAETVAAAQKMLERWEQITERVPGLNNIVSIAPELPGEDVRLSSDDWAVLVAAGPSRPVSAVLDVLGATEFAGCAKLAELVDRSLVVVGEPDPLTQAQAAVESLSAEVAAGAFAAVDEPGDSVEAVEPPEPVGSVEPVEPVESVESVESVDSNETVAPEQEGSCVPGPAGATAGGVETPGDSPTESVVAGDQGTQPQVSAEAELPSTEQVPPAPEPAVLADDVPLAQQFPQESTATVESPVAPVPAAPQEAAGGPEMGRGPAETPQEFPDHFPIDDLVSDDEGVGWEQADPAAAHGAGAAQNPGVAQVAQPAAATAMPQNHAPGSASGLPRLGIQPQGGIPQPDAGQQPAAPSQAQAQPQAQAADPFSPSAAQPAAEGASDDVLSQISKLSPKAAEAIAVALGDEDSP